MSYKFAIKRTLSKEITTTMVIAHFTPVTGALGGALIGLSAATLLLLSGEILGASGLASSFFLEPRKTVTDPSVAWKIVFLAIFMLITNVALSPYYTDDERWGEDPSIPVPSVTGYLLGGAFVGFGTRLGNGCTTGHGICGMARFSKRSILAVCTFMASAIATAAFLSPDNKALANFTSFLRTEAGAPDLYNKWVGFGVSMIVVLPALYAVYNLLKGGDDTAEDIPTGTEGSTPFSAANESTQLDKNTSSGYDTENPSSGGTTNLSRAKTESVGSEPFRKIIVAVLAAVLFAVGLAISQMVLPSKVLGFLALYTLSKGTYDPTLITVMGGGVIVSFISYQFVQGWAVLPSRFTRSCPFVSEKFSVPTNTTLDKQLFGGAFCFGVGWAIVGLCPGPAIFLAASGTKPVVLLWWPAFIAGSFVAMKVKERS